MEKEENPIEDTSTTEAANTEATENEAPQGAAQENEADAPAQEQAEDPHAARNALLDSISEPDPNAPKPETEPEPEAKEEEGKPPEKGEPGAKPPAAKTPEQEEAEILEGVKSERGRERIKAMIAGNRQLKADINEFREMVVSTGMSPDEFAKTLEFGRLSHSTKEADRHLALAMLDDVRAELVKELGIEAPGVDPLADFKDLSEDVENMAITREKAIELAKYRRREAMAQIATQQQQAASQSNKEYQAQINQAATIAEEYFKTREKEADYPLKMKQIHEWFANEDNKREFVQNYEPKQWFGVFRMMYDNIRVVQPKNGARPISSRPAAMGAPRTDTMDNVSRLLNRVDSMGI